MATALRRAESAADPQHSRFVYSDIAAAQARDGDFAGARRTADLVPDPDFRGSLLESVAGAMAEAGQVSQAFELAESIPDADQYGFHYQSLARGRIAAAQARRGDMAGANRTAALIPFPDLKARALENIALARQAAPVAEDPPVDWLGCLEDSAPTNPCSLNMPIFLDLAGHLRAHTATDDLEQLVMRLLDIARKLHATEVVISRLLERQSMNPRSNP
jgi:hypothetical protein